MNKMIRSPIVLAAVLFSIGAMPAFADDLMVRGKQTFDKLCASCHGNAGIGDGPVGKALPPGTLPDLTKGSFKYATDDAKKKEFIKKGGAAVGLSPLMPAHPSLTDDELDALIAFVKSLKK